VTSATDRFVSVLEGSGERAALVDGDKTLSYAELAAAARGLAADWAQAGAVRGDRIAVELPNGADFVVCYIAGLLGNYTIVPVNNGLPAADLKYILEVTKPTLHVKGRLELTSRFEQPDLTPVDPDNTFAISFTSGTTSRPKGVCHRVEALLANAFAFNASTGLDENTRMLHVLPMGYMAGFLNTILSPLACGGAIVIAPQFSAATARTFWVAVREQVANAMWLTPTMVALLARLHRDPEVSEWTRHHLRHVFVGTAPLPTLSADRFSEAFGVPCLESYGMTEVLIVSVASESTGKASGTVGKLLDGVRVESRDAAGVPQSSGNEGDLFVASPYELKGYLNPDTGSVELDKDGDFFATGDFGHLDVDTNLFITGRTKDLIIRGGTNVSPRAVEESLLAYPGVIEAAVVGAPHEFWGEEVVAFLVVDGEPPALEALQAHCRDLLVEDAIPTRVETLDELPKSSTGKIAKNVLRESL